MVSKFLQRTVVSHLSLVGVGYLIVRIFGDYIWPNEEAETPVHPTLIFVVTLIGAICYGHWVMKYRPVPHNPIQQAQINFLIAIYSLVVAFSLALPLHASLTNPYLEGAWPLLIITYLYFACGLLYRVDHPVEQDATDRRRTEWQRALDDAKKYRA
jgi:hypothetical protein